MSSTKFGVVVSTGNAIILRYIYPTNDTELSLMKLSAGETLIQVNRGPYISTAAWQTAVNNAVQTTLGKPPGNARCCVVDGSGNVVNVIMADATLAASLFPGMTLVNSTVGGIGWTWTLQGGFVQPTFIVRQLP